MIADNCNSDNFSKVWAMALPYEAPMGLPYTQYRAHGPTGSGAKYGTMGLGLRAGPKGWTMGPGIRARPLSLDRGADQGAGAGRSRGWEENKLIFDGDLEDTIICCK